MPTSTFSRSPELALGLPDQWYVVCPDLRLTGAPHAFVVCGRQVSLYRDSAGALHWDEPGLTVVERDGYVWLWCGDSLPTKSPPAMPQVYRRRTVWEYGSVRMAAGFIDVMENTIDLIHPVFAHPFTHPTWWLHKIGITPTLNLVVRPHAGGWEAEGFLGKRRLMWQEYLLPDRVRLLLLPGTWWEMEVIAHHVPESADSCRFEYVMGRNAAPWERTRRYDVPGGRKLHWQDQALMAALTDNRRHYPGIGEQHAAADAYTLLFRKVYGLAEAGRWQETWQDLPSPVEVGLRL